MEIKCPDCDQYYPAEQVDCPACNKKQDTKPQIPPQIKQSPTAIKKRPIKKGVIILGILIFFFFVLYLSSLKNTSINSPSLPTSDNPKSATDDQIYREFELCMNSAKEKISDNKLEGRRIAAYCVGRLQKYDQKQAKKAFDLYFDLD